MDSPEPRKLQSAGDPDDETMAAKKRSRRVSFAETTAVHVFDRDEDFETPPGSAEDRPKCDHTDSDDDSKGSTRDDDDDDDDEDGEQLLFVRGMDSSSPGSAVGSVTSNDDDNFFGPVSASFIRSGRLSESGVSEDNNHDITLDSTAFSLHYRSIAPPDDRSANSAGSVWTPMEESMPARSRGFEKSKMSGSVCDSTNNMSLIVDDPKRYDYGKMSPTLEALLAEVGRSMQPSSPDRAKESGKGKAHFGGNVVASDDGARGGHVLDTSADKVCGSMPSYDTPVSSHKDACTNAITQDIVHVVAEDYYKGDNVTTQYEAVVSNSQSSDLLSPPYSQVNFNFPSNNINQHYFEGEGNFGRSHLKTPPGSVPLASKLVIIDGQQQLELESGIRTPTNAVQAFQIRLPGSVSSIHAKRQQLFLDHTVLPPTKLLKSLDREQPPSSLEMEFRRHDEKISAIKNQISRFKILETPILSSRPAFLEQEDILLDPEGTSKKLTDDAKMEHVGASVNSIEYNLIHAPEKPRDNQISFLEAGSETPNNGKHSERNMVTGETIELTNTRLTFQLEPGINVNQDLLTSHKSIDCGSTPNGHGSSQSLAKVEFKKKGQVRNTSSRITSTHAQMPEYNLTTPEGVFIPEAHGTIWSSTSLEENGMQSSTSFTTPVSNDLRRLESLKELANNYNDSLLCTSQEKAERSTNIEARSRDINIEIKKDLVEKLSQSETFDSSCEPTRGEAYEEAASVKVSDKGTGKVSDINLLPLINPVGSIPSTSTQDPQQHGYEVNNQDIFSFQESNFAQDVDIVGRKRKNGHVFLKENNLIEETNRPQKSVKLLPKAVGDIPASPVEGGDEATDIGGHTTMRQCTDIFLKVSEASKELFSTSVNSLSLEKIDIMECIVGELQMARKYERFYTALKNNERLDDPHQQRIAEARSLQDKLLFEQVKLQLKRVKLHLLHNKAHLCQSRHRECHNLKSMLSQLISGTRASQIHEINLNSGAVESCNRDQEVASKKQELELLDQKVKCLVKALEASCKINGNMDCDQIIEKLNESLEIRKRCRVIRQDLQLWELRDIVKKNDQSEIVLNYCNLLCQRFTINIGQGSSIIAKNLLDVADIEKNFPKMNAPMVFEFVFNSKSTHKLTDSKAFQHKTLVTCLLLGTLLDVLEEVQVTRRELWNLVSSTFHSQCLGQLELQLSFHNYKKCGKVTLGLDLTCLDCGVYPSKPSELQLRIIPGAQTTLPQSILDEIMNSVQRFQYGRPMILRLCRYISELVQALS